MRKPAVEVTVAPVPDNREAAALADLRFRALVAPERWRLVPDAVRRRFSKRVADRATVLYAGQIVETRMSPAGWLLAQVCRLIGGPLPLSRDTGVPAVVSVTEDVGSRGQFWTRIYGRHRGFPQVIHSSKRFQGPTGLEEYLGCGVGMALTVRADGSGLRFVSDHYFLALAGLRVRLPGWASPGRVEVGHLDRGDAGFAFTLSLVHPWLGELIHQTAEFRDLPSTP